MMQNKKNQILNQIRELRRSAVKHKAILSFKYSNLMTKINFVQVSVIFISTAITFMETIKSKFEYTGWWWDMCPIIFGTYIALVTAILRFFKWEERKEEISKSKENHIFIINKFLKTKNTIENTEINKDNLETWNNIVATYENDTFDNYINIRETFDTIMPYKELIYYKTKFKNLYLEMKLVNNDIEYINKNKNAIPKNYYNDLNCWYKYFCCKSKINHESFFDENESEYETESESESETNSEDNNCYILTVT